MKTQTMNQTSKHIGGGCELCGETVRTGQQFVLSTKGGSYVNGRRMRDLYHVECIRERFGAAAV
jgi:hypothetical protein